MRAFKYSPSDRARGRRRLLALTAAAALVAAGAVTASASAAATRAAAGPTPSACQKSIDPYSISRTAAQACGDTVYPLSKTQALAGGGKIYDYEIDGTATSIRVAPKGFQPLTATGAQLREYGFPSRPNGGRALTAWTNMMRGIGASRTSAPAPAYLLADPAASVRSNAAINQGNWAGNVATAGDGYKEVIATYNEPVSHSSQCASTAMSAWIGIGNFNPSDPGGPLVQEGTAVDWPGLSTDQAWWEDWPANKPIAQPFFATPGEPFYLDEWVADNTLYFFWYNEYLDTYANAQGSETLGYHGDSAEFMIEKVASIDLTNFESFNVSDAQASSPDIQGGAFVGLGELAHADYQIADSSGYVLAYAGATSNAGQNWTYYQRRCY